MRYVVEYGSYDTIYAKLHMNMTYRCLKERFIRGAGAQTTGYIYGKNDFGMSVDCRIQDIIIGRGFG